MKEGREESNEKTGKTSNRGFASMSREQQREIARKGGQAVSRNKAHMAAIGSRGGEAVSRNRGHMAAIGRKGGEAVSRDREHMARIGRKGGVSSGNRTGRKASERDTNQSESGQE
jgi:uncharacterized protein